MSPAPFSPPYHTPVSGGLQAHIRGPWSGGHRPWQEASASAPALHPMTSTFDQPLPPLGFHFPSVTMIAATFLKHAPPCVRYQAKNVLRLT